MRVLFFDLELQFLRNLLSLKDPGNAQQKRVRTKQVRKMTDGQLLPTEGQMMFFLVCRQC